MSNVKIIYSIALLTYVALAACDSTNPDGAQYSVQRKIYSDVIISVTDRVTRDRDLNGKTLLIENTYPDGFKPTSISFVESGAVQVTDGEKDLILDLKKSINDSVEASLDRLYSSSYKILTYEKNKQKADDLAKKEEIFGIINLSPIALNSFERRGCFYYALQCGKKCGGGYFVFVNKEGDEWKVDTIVPAWE